MVPANSADQEALSKNEVGSELGGSCPNQYLCSLRFVRPRPVPSRKANPAMDRVLRRGQAVADGAHRCSPEGGIDLFLIKPGVSVPRCRLLRAVCRCGTGWSECAPGGTEPSKGKKKV